jgi:hypothetical protein
MDNKLDLVKALMLLPIRERDQLISNATDRYIRKTENLQGFSMTKTKRQMYKIGFDDAVDWLISETVALKTVDNKS